MRVRSFHFSFPGDQVIMNSRFPKVLRATLWFIALVQIVLGAGFLAAPELTAQRLGLSLAPGWANWLLGMMAARFLAFGYGMFLAARDPVAARPWITAMIAVQAIDWLVTLKYLALGAVTLTQVSTASFLPVVFIAGFGGLWLAPTYAMLAVFQVFRRGLHYAIDRPVRELLFAGLSADARYKAKTFIDTFVYRTGDMVGGWTPVAMLKLGLAATVVAPLAIGVSVVWLAVAAVLGWLYVREVRKSDEVMK